MSSVHTSSTTKKKENSLSFDSLLTAATNISNNSLEILKRNDYGDAKKKKTTEKKLKRSKNK